MKIELYLQPSADRLLVFEKLNDILSKLALDMAINPNDKYSIFLKIQSIEEESKPICYGKFDITCPNMNYGGCKYMIECKAKTEASQ